MVVFKYDMVLGRCAHGCVQIRYGKWMSAHGCVQIRHGVGRVRSWLCSNTVWYIGERSWLCSNTTWMMGALVRCVQIRFHTLPAVEVCESDEPDTSRGDESLLGCFSQVFRRLCGLSHKQMPIQ